MCIREASASKQLQLTLIVLYTIRLIALLYYQGFIQDFRLRGGNCYIRGIAYIAGGQRPEQSVGRCKRGVWGSSPVKLLSFTFSENYFPVLWGIVLYKQMHFTLTLKQYYCHAAACCEFIKI